MKYLFSKDSLQWFYSKEGNNPDGSKFAEKVTHTKKCKKLKNLFEFSELCSTNTLTHPLRELLQKEINFDWTGTCNEAFGELKLCMNSDICLGYFDKSI